MSKKDINKIRPPKVKEYGNGDDFTRKERKDYFDVVMRSKSDPVWFVNNILGIKLFPKQEEIMRKFYAYKYKNVRTRKRNLYIVGGMRGGKTALGGVIGAYEFFEVATLLNPAEYYDLLPGQLISLSAVATSEKQVMDGIFWNLKTNLERSEWMNSWLDYEIKRDEVYLKSKNIKFRALSSSAQSAVGRSNKCVIFDELANFEETDGKRGAWEIFNKLKRSTDTFHEDGHTIAISSPNHPQDIIMDLYGRSRFEPQTLGLKVPTWEMNPNMSRKELMKEYRFNLPEFYRDYACEPSASGGLQFPGGVIFEDAPNKLFDIKDQIGDRKRHIGAIDPAAVNDGFGFGIGYLGTNNKIIVDGITKFQKEKTEVYIKPTVVKEYIDDAIDKFNIDTIIFDTWMFPELLQHLEEERNITIIKHIVDKESYDMWRELQDEERVSVVFDEALQREAENLVVLQNNRGPKVDHKHSFSKDMADCVANIIWYFSSEEFDEPRRKFISSRII